MGSALPICWVPCFDGGLFKNAGRASYWRAPHAQLFRYASPRTMQFFAYALTKKDDPDALGFLSRALAADDRQAVLKGTRNLRCTAVSPWVAGRTVVRRDWTWRSVRPDAVRAGEATIEVFCFEPVGLEVGADASIVDTERGVDTNIRRFRVVDLPTYADVMTSVTAHRIGELATAPTGNPYARR